MENASITMLDFILAANGKPDPANQLHEVFFQIVPSTSVFNNNDSAPRSSTNFIFETSIPVSFRWFDFDFSFTTLYLVHHALFAFGLATTASSLKKSTEHLLAGNATPRLTTFADPGGTLQEISYSAAELSFQSSGYEANMERRRKMKMGNSKPQLPPRKPPDPPLRGSCCWSSPWKMREEEDALLLLEAFSLLCVFVVHELGRVPCLLLWARTLGHLV